MDLVLVTGASGFLASNINNNALKKNATPKIPISIIKILNLEAWLRHTKPSDMREYKKITK